LKIPKEFENKILTKFYIHLRFNSYFNTLRAMQALEGSSYEQRELRINHLYGSLKVGKNSYSEVLDTDISSVVQERVNLSKKREKTKIATIPDEEYQLPIFLDEIPDAEFPDLHLKKVDEGQETQEAQEIQELLTKNEENEISQEELYTIDFIDSLSRDVEHNSLKAKN